MNDTIQKPGRGKQLSKRIYLLIMGVLVIAVLCIVWGLSSGYSKALKKKSEVENTIVSDVQDALKKIPDSVSGGNSEGNISFTHNSNGKNLNPSSVKNSSASSKSGQIQDDYEKQLQLQMAKLQMQALQSAMDSSLTLSSANSLLLKTNQGNSAEGNTKTDVTVTKEASSTAFQSANLQANKEDFYNNAGKEDNTMLASGPKNQKYKLEVTAGTVIPAVLQTGINSDLPGTITARVKRSVYDSTTGRDVLIPQGATLIGLYSSQIAYGQERVLIVWSRVIFPDGQSLNLEGMPGADLSGYAGLSDKVNNHYFRIFSAAILMSLFTAGIEASQAGTGWGNTSNQTGFNAGQIISGALGLQLGQAGLALMQKNLDIQPTIEIRPGCEFNVLVTRDIPFKKSYKITVS